MNEEADIISSLLNAHPALTVLTSEEGNERIRCSLTGHEIPFTKEAISAYVNGPNYKRCRRLKEWLERYKDHLEDRG